MTNISHHRPLRHVILHNHLFKNAGTSVDHILRNNFGPRWITREFDTVGAANTHDIEAWITANPNAVAFSTHTLLGPMPDLDDVEITPVTFLRDPIERISSAYQFERQQLNDTRGTQLARQNGLAGYVHARLAIPGDRQCCNFQTHRLAALSDGPKGAELVKSMRIASQIANSGVLGLVPDFDAAMTRLSQIVRSFTSEFECQPVIENASNPRTSHAISPDMRQLLADANTDDIALLEYVTKILNPQNYHYPKRESEPV